MMDTPKESKLTGIFSISPGKDVYGELTLAGAKTSLYLRDKQLFLDRDEILRHGSLIIEDCFKQGEALDTDELEKIHHRTEQEFYSIDFVTDVLKQFCGADFAQILPPFVEMLVFDALIGSMDRHSQNWGLVAKSREPAVTDSEMDEIWPMIQVGTPVEIRP